MTESSASLGRLLRADRYHAGVRVAALVVWFLAIAVAYVVVGLIVRVVLGPASGVGVLLIVVAAIVMAQPLAWLAEKQLLVHWPSGRAAELESGQLTWRDRGQVTRLDLRQKVNYWRWRFAVRRRHGGRVPSNYHCFAIRLVQGDAVVSLYSFLSPAAVEALTARYPFYELRRPSDNAKPSLGGRDAMFLAAEHSRWESGAELDPADFEALIAHLAANVPGFEQGAQSGA
jgi:hypothetical protein